MRRGTERDRPEALHRRRLAAPRQGSSPQAETDPLARLGKRRSRRRA